MRQADVPVLIVGGGPVGLSASLLLSRHGIRSVLVERHQGTSVHPKARGLNVRTLELFRVWGLESAVRAAAGELSRPLDVVWAPTLVAPETKRVPYGDDAERLQSDSPTTSVGCAQDKLEPVLLEVARSYGLGELHFAHELTALKGHPCRACPNEVGSSGRGRHSSRAFRSTAVGSNASHRRSPSSPVSHLPKGSSGSRPAPTSSRAATRRSRFSWSLAGVTSRSPGSSGTPCRRAATDPVVSNRAAGCSRSHARAPAGACVFLSSR